MTVHNPNKGRQRWFAQRWDIVLREFAFCSGWLYPILDYPTNPIQVNFASQFEEQRTINGNWLPRSRTWAFGCALLAPYRNEKGFTRCFGSFLQGGVGTERNLALGFRGPGVWDNQESNR